MTLTSENEVNGYQTKLFRLVTQDQQLEQSIQLIFCPSWPHHCPQMSMVTDFTGLVQSLHDQNNSNPSSPMVIIDRFGGTEAATFCALTSLLKQLEFESHVDIYYYTKMSHLRRPGIWRTQDDFFFIYRVLDSICSSIPSSSSTSSSVYSSNGMFEESSFQTFQPVTFVPPPVVPPVCNGHHAQVIPIQGTIIRIPPDGRETLLRQQDTYQRF